MVEELPTGLHFRRPCFIYYQAYSELTKGGMLSDAIITMSSLNLIAGEMDASLTTSIYDF